MNYLTELPKRYRYQYRESEFAGSVRHSFELIGERGGCHVHLTDYGKAPRRGYFHSRYSGGVEMHYRTARQAGRPDTPPDHDRCHILQTPCWHVGSSLYIEERVVPYLGERDIEQADRGYIFRCAIEFADSNLREPVEDEA